MFLFEKKINCPSCNKKIRESAQFCIHCGAVLGNGAQKNTKKQRGASADTRTQQNMATGFSYGPNMPAEENQYSYPGEWKDYFRMIFKEDFPEYRVIETENPMINRKKLKSYGYSFNRDGKIFLIVDVRSEKCRSNVLRESCEENGIPYLRFYFDHERWWNTREYVVQRVKKVLG